MCDRVGILSAGELMAVDGVEALRQTVGPGTELRLRVAGEIGVEVAAIDGIESAAWSRDVWRVMAT